MDCRLLSRCGKRSSTLDVAGSEQFRQVLVAVDDGGEHAGVLLPVLQGARAAVEDEGEAGAYAPVHPCIRRRYRLSPSSRHHDPARLRPPSGGSRCRDSCDGQRWAYGRLPPSSCRRLYLRGCCELNVRTQLAAIQICSFNQIRLFPDRCIAGLHRRRDEHRRKSEHLHGGEHEVRVRSAARGVGWRPSVSAKRRRARRWPSWRKPYSFPAERLGRCTERRTPDGRCG